MSRLLSDADGAKAPRQGKGKAGLPASRIVGRKPAGAAIGGIGTQSFFAERIFTGSSGTFCIMLRLPVGTWAIWSTTSIPRTTLPNTA